MNKLKKTLYRILSEVVCILVMYVIVLAIAGGLMAISALLLKLIN